MNNKFLLLIIRIPYLFKNFLNCRVFLNFKLFQIKKFKNFKNKLF